MVGEHGFDEMGGWDEMSGQICLEEIFGENSWEEMVGLNLRCIG
jgi:hypothetical protein